MKFLSPTILVLAIFVISGCIAPKKLNRDNGYFGPLKEQKSGVYSSDKVLTGKLNLLYEYKIKGAPTDPIILGDQYLSIRTSRNRVVLYDQETGNRVCKIKRGRGFILPPVITDSLIIYVKKSPMGQIKVQNLFTGKKLGELHVKDIRSGPIIINNSLIAGTTTGLLSLELAELSMEWRHQNDDVVDIPPIHDDRVIFYATGSGLVKAVIPDDGSLKWEIDCGASISSQLGIGSYLYVGLSDGDILALDKNSGDIVWRKNIEYAIRGKAVENNDKVILGCTDGKVYCLSRIDGGIIWEYQSGGIIVANPVIHGNTVLIGSYDKKFYSLNIESGEMLDSQTLEGPISFAAAINDNKIFVACQKNRIYCFEEH